MKTSIFAGLAAAALLSTAMANAEGPTIAAKAIKGGGFVDPAGAVSPKAPALTKAAPAGSPAKACLQLHLGATVFNFALDINADTYPYPITGGTITGGICGAPWHVTGGSLGNALTINGAINTPVPNCSSTIAVVGNANVPSGYAGTYGFNGSSTMFSHHTLFLGYQKATCP